MESQLKNARLLASINKHVKLDESEIEKLNSLIQYKVFKKNQYLASKDMYLANSYYVLSGCLQTFLIDDNGKEHILLFSPADWWTGDLCNFYENKYASLLTIKAIKQTEVIILTHETKEILYNESRNFERYFRILAERSLIELQHRFLDLLSSSVNERYKEFIEKYPNLMTQLSQRQIAGYLGITPEFLSKIKNKS